MTAPNTRCPLYHQYRKRRPKANGRSRPCGRRQSPLSRPNRNRTLLYSTRRRRQALPDFAPSRSISTKTRGLGDLFVTLGTPETGTGLMPVLDDVSHDRKVFSALGYHPAPSGFPCLRRRGCGSRPGNGSPLSYLFSGGEMGAPRVQVVQDPSTTRRLL